VTALASGVAGCAGARCAANDCVAGAEAFVPCVRSTGRVMVMSLRKACTAK
jgi:hypothetical protein